MENPESQSTPARNPESQSTYISFSYPPSTPPELTKRVFPMGQSKDSCQPSTLRAAAGAMFLGPGSGGGGAGRSDNGLRGRPVNP
jgi:hypothetical protein